MRVAAVRLRTLLNMRGPMRKGRFRLNSHRVFPSRTSTRICFTSIAPSVCEIPAAEESTLRTGLYRRALKTVTPERSRYVLMECAGASEKFDLLVVATTPKVPSAFKASCRAWDSIAYSLALITPIFGPSVHQEIPKKGHCRASAFFARAKS
jgi:hypothetical protein